MAMTNVQRKRVDGHLGFPVTGRGARLRTAAWAHFPALDYWNSLLY